MFNKIIYYNPVHIVIQLRFTSIYFNHVPEIEDNFSPS